MSFDSDESRLIYSLADDGVSTAKIADDAVVSSKVANNNITADELNVAGDGTAGQVLSSDGDGSFSWVEASNATSIND